MLTANEERYCSEISGRIERVRALLAKDNLCQPVHPQTWYTFLAALKEIQGNVNNDLSFVATLIAKAYLSSKFDVVFDAAEKPQGASGIDIDVTAKDGQRIVAEIKTAVPYQGTDFGAQQIVAFKKDFAKLAAAEAAHKFLFVTEPTAFAVMKKPKYLAQIAGVRLVLITTGEELVA
jgi:hypothetical protein